MDVAGEIGEDLFWPGERSLGKDHPLLVGGAREMCLERRRCIQSHEIAEKLQFAGVMDEQAAEQRGEHEHRHEEFGPAGNPAIMSRGEAAARYDTVNMRVVVKLLSPGVQDGDHADVGTKVLGIGSNGGERLSDNREQETVDLRFVLVGDGSQSRRQCEYDMEIRNRQ